MNYAESLEGYRHLNIDYKNWILKIFKEIIIGKVMLFIFVYTTETFLLTTKTLPQSLHSTDKKEKNVAFDQEKW